MAAKLILNELGQALFAKPRRLPEPDELHLDGTRELIDQGFRAFNLVEEE